jgi:hypothetical protein
MFSQGVMMKNAKIEKFEELERLVPGPWGTLHNPTVQHKHLAYSARVLFLFCVALWCLIARPSHATDSPFAGEYTWYIYTAPDVATGPYTVIVSPDGSAVFLTIGDIHGSVTLDGTVSLSGYYIATIDGVPLRHDADIAGQLIISGDSITGSGIFTAIGEGLSPALWPWQATKNGVGDDDDDDADDDDAHDTNAPPLFTIGPNQAVAKNSVLKTVSGWATDISPGSDDEADQALNFIVTNDNPTIFSTQPAISVVPAQPGAKPTGKLTFKPMTGKTGIATVTVKLHDNGGTDNGGQDTSAAQTFTILVGPITVVFETKPPATMIPTTLRRLTSLDEEATEGSEYQQVRINANGDAQKKRMVVQVLENGKPAASQYTLQVEITVTDGDSSGAAGHVKSQHNDNRPHGYLLQTSDDVDFATTLVRRKWPGGWQQAGILVEEATDTQGKATAYYLPSEIAGIETIEFSVKDHPEVEPVKAKVIVRWPNLVELTSSEAAANFSELTGMQATHGSKNHFGTAQTKAAVLRAGQSYRKKQEQENLNGSKNLVKNISDLLVKLKLPPLKHDLMGINDISLPWGGLFDVGDGGYTGGDWASPHGGHRWGYEVDIQTTDLATNLKSTKAGVIGPSVGYYPANKKSFSPDETKLNNLFKELQKKQLELLQQSFPAGTVGVEGNHFHVKFAQ